jgi:hypothetical protein
MDVGTNNDVTSVLSLDANLAYQAFSRSRPAEVFQICADKGCSKKIKRIAIYASGFGRIHRTLNFAASWETADVCGFYRCLPSDDGSNLAD